MPQKKESYNISINTEKASDKIQHSFIHDKTEKQVGEKLPQLNFLKNLKIYLKVKNCFS